MTPDQLERILKMDAEGKSARQIAAEPDMPSHTTIAKWLNRRREKELESQGVATETSEALNRVYTPPVNPEKVYTAFGPARHPEDSPVVRLSLSRSLVGMFLSPKELLDAKEADALPPNAWLDAWGRVELREAGAEPLWPAYSQPSIEKTPNGEKPSGTRFIKLHPEGSRGAHRTNR
jgi:hypothetical protein